MPSYVTPKKNTAFRCYVSLASQSSTHIMQSNPTLASGDVKVSTDGGALANLTTLPSVAPASSKLVQVDLSASEMNGDNIMVIFSDQAGSEWDDLVLLIQTTARQIDDLAYPATSGRSLAVDTSGQVTIGAVANDAITAAAIATDAIGSNELASSAVTKIQTGLPLATDYTAIRAAKLDNLDVAVSSRGTGDATAANQTTINNNVLALPSANANADALLDRASGVETNRTLRQSLRLILAALSGKLSGAATTTVTIRDTNDSKDRITATVDSDGNRTAVSYDVS